MCPITTDASPYGIGAILEPNGVIVPFFADQIHITDREVLGLGQVASSSDQLAAEALAV